MKHAYLMIGVSGSGKSTVVKTLIAKAEEAGQTARVFSLDLLLLPFCNQRGFFTEGSEKEQYRAAHKYCNEESKDYFKFVDEDWKDALTNDIVIVDNMHLTKKSRARWCADLKAKGFQITAVQVMAPLQTIIDRQISRTDKSLPENVVRNFYKQVQEVMVGSEVDFLININGGE